jgi:hypothetical protein
LRGRYRRAVRSVNNADRRARRSRPEGPPLRARFPHQELEALLCARRGQEVRPQSRQGACGASFPPRVHVARGQLADAAIGRREEPGEAPRLVSYRCATVRREPGASGLGAGVVVAEGEGGGAEVSAPLRSSGRARELRRRGRRRGSRNVRPGASTRRRHPLRCAPSRCRRRCSRRGGRRSHSGRRRRARPPIPPRRALRRRRGCSPSRRAGATLLRPPRRRALPGSRRENAARARTWARAWTGVRRRRPRPTSRAECRGPERGAPRRPPPRGR